jgi:hypothetical protein
VPAGAVGVDELPSGAIPLVAPSPAGGIKAPAGMAGSVVSLGARFVAGISWEGLAADRPVFGRGSSTGLDWVAIGSLPDEPGPGAGVGELVPEVVSPAFGYNSPAGESSGSGPGDDRRFDDRMQPTDMATPTSPIMARRTFRVRRSCGIERS